MKVQGYHPGNAVSQINVNAIGELPGVVPSPPSSIFNQNNTGYDNLQAQTNAATEFTIYTLLPQDKPVIISSAEYLPLQDTNEITSFGFNQDHDRDYALSVKEAAQTLTASTAAKIIVVKDDTLTKIIEKRLSFDNIANKQLAPVSDLLIKLEEAVSSLDIRSNYTLFFTIDDLLSSANIKDLSLNIAKFSNTTIYSTILLLLKQQIILHSNNSVIYGSTPQINIQDYYKKTLYDLVTVPSTQNKLGLISPPKAKDKTPFANHVVLNKNLDSSTNGALLLIATIGLVAPVATGLQPQTKGSYSPPTTINNQQQVLASFSPYISSTPLGSISIPSFLGDPFFGLSIVPLLECNTAKEIYSYKDKTDRLFGLTLFNLLKEESYSRWLSTTEHQANLVGAKIAYDIAPAGAPNFAIWDSLIGVFLKNITDFTNADDTDPGTSLLSLTKQVKQTGTTPAPAGVDNEFRILSLEVNDNPEIVEFKAGDTNGATYYLEAALAGKINLSNSSISLSPEKADELLTKINNAKQSMNFVSGLNDVLRLSFSGIAGSDPADFIGYGGYDVTLYDLMLNDASKGIKKTLDTIYFKTGLIKVHTATKSVDSIVLNKDSQILIDNNNFLKFNYVHGHRSGRILASLIKRTKALAFSEKLAEKRVGESILRAIFSICLKRMYQLDFDSVGSKIDSSGYSPFEQSSRIKYFGDTEALDILTLAGKNQVLSSKLADVDLRRKAAYLTLIDANGNANSPELAIDGLIFAHPEMFPVTTADTNKTSFKLNLAADASDEVITNFVLVERGNIKADQIITANQDNLLNKGISLFDKHVSLHKNILFNSIASCLHKIRRQDGLFRRDGDFPASGGSIDDSTTTYGGISKISFMWNYFLVLVNAISVLTPEEFLGPCELTQNDDPGVNASVHPRHTSRGGYSTIFSNATITHQGSSIIKTVTSNVSPKTGGYFNFLYDTELNPVTLNSSNSIAINEISSMNQRISVLNSFLSNMSDKVGQFKNYLNKINEKGHPLSDYYNQFYLAVDSEARSNPKMKNYLVSQAFSQEQLIHSSHIASEIIDRFSEGHRSLARIAIQNLATTGIRPEYNTTAMFPQKEVMSDKIGYNVENIDFLPVNSFDAFSYSIIRKYFTIEPALNKKNGNNVRIITVGIPPRMVRKLSGIPSLMSSLDKAKTLAKNIIKLKVYKSDLLNPGLPYLPKEFKFDLMRYPTRVISNWDKFNINDYANSDDFIKNVPTKIFSLAGEKSFGLNQSYPDSARKSALDVIPQDKQEEYTAIYNNHVKSFLLEEYINLFTSARIDEGHFYHYINLEKSLKNARAQFDSYIGTTNNTFDASNLAEKMPASARERGEDVIIIKAREESVKRYFMNETVFLPEEEIRKKIFLPKKFDRTFTVAIDPDDFELDKKAIKTNNDLRAIYTAQVNKGIFLSGLLESNNEGESFKRVIPSSQSEIFIDEYWVEVAVDY